MIRIEGWFKTKVKLSQNSLQDLIWGGGGGLDGALSKEPHPWLHPITFN